MLPAEFIQGFSFSFIKFFSSLLFSWLIRLFLTQPSLPIQFFSPIQFSYSIQPSLPILLFSSILRLLILLLYIIPEFVVIWCTFHLEPSYIKPSFFHNINLSLFLFNRHHLSLIISMLIGFLRSFLFINFIVRWLCLTFKHQCGHHYVYYSTLINWSYLRLFQQQQLSSHHFYFYFSLLHDFPLLFFRYTTWCQVDTQLHRLSLFVIVNRLNLDFALVFHGFLSWMGCFIVV